MGVEAAAIITHMNSPSHQGSKDEHLELVISIGGMHCVLQFYSEVLVTCHNLTLTLDFMKARGAMTIEIWRLKCFVWL